MKYGLFAINYGTCATPDNAIRVARHAEAAGFESVWAGEHLVLPDPQPDGFAIAPTLPFLDSIVGLTLVAAETSTIGIGSGIIQLPLHHPVSLAKQLASLDQVSNGRLTVGVGAGYVEAEFASLGIALSERGARMDEHLDAMRALWTMPKPEYHGTFVDFCDVNAYPRPVRPSGPPILVGGVSAGARRRAIRKADGWYLFSTTIDSAKQAMQVIATDPEQQRRPPELGRLEITMTPVGPFDRGVADHYEQLGVDRLVLLPRVEAPADRRHEPVPLDDMLRTIDSLAATILDR